MGCSIRPCPAARRDLAKGLVLERIARVPKEKTTQPDETHAVEAVNRAREDEGPVVNFYTDGKVRVPGMPAGFFTVKKILVDAGSVVNLMPESIADEMRLRKERGPGFNIKTADGGLAPISSVVSFDLNVAGVTARITCHLVPGLRTPSYSILLSRRWLRQCQARGDYRLDTYVIKDKKGNEFLVPAVRGGHEESPRIFISAESTRIEIDDEMAEDIEEGDDTMSAIVERISRESDEQERWELELERREFEEKGAKRGENEEELRAAKWNEGFRDSWRSSLQLGEALKGPHC